jgi:hypothetical protein
MTDTNGAAPDFTHQLTPFTLNGETFRRVKVDARVWATTLARVAASERAEMEKPEGSVLFGVSAEGLSELILLAIHPDDRPQWTDMNDAGLIEFGELTSIRDWLWEEMTERPFKSDTPSSDGPGSSSDRSSRAGSSSRAGAPTS